MNDKPVFRVGAAGLDPRDWRLIEIVFRHSQYNRFEFRLATRVEADGIDILIANAAEPEGREALARIRESSRPIPVIAALTRGAVSAARHAISIDRLTLQLLPILNRVVELELLEQGASPVAGAGAAPAPMPNPVDGPAAGELARASASGTGTGTAGAMVAEARPDAFADRAPWPRPLAPAAPVMPVPARSPESVAQPGPSAPFEPVARPEPVALPESAAARQESVPPQESTARQESVARPETATPPETATRPAARPAAGPTPPEPAPAARSKLLQFPRQGAGEAGAAPRLRVLVVDDSPTVRRQLALAFDRLGLECDPVASAHEALGRLDESHYDLILVDVVMPDMDGYKLTREIKRKRRMRGTPVIILTSRSSPFDLARGALAGCDTYLTKPVPFRALEAAVVRQLRRSLAIDDLAGFVRGADDPAGQEPLRPVQPPRSRVARFFGR